MISDFRRSQVTPSSNENNGVKDEQQTNKQNKQNKKIDRDLTDSEYLLL
jgi:hypothetical protein